MNSYAGTSIQSRSYGTNVSGLTTTVPSVADT